MAGLSSGEAWRSLPPEEQVEYLVRLLAETEAALTELTGGADLVVDPATATTVLLRDAQAQLQAEHEDLERRVAERTAELAHSVAELSATAAELRAANAALQAEIAERLRLQQQLEQERAMLERRVEERTAQLTRANQELSHSREQLQALAHRLLAAQETERRAIARELHDETGQILTVLSIELGQLARDAAFSPPVAKRLVEQQQLLSNLMQDLHELIVTLRPASLDRAGLLPAITQYTESLRRRQALDIDLVAIGLEDRRLPADVETTVYRLVQEALTNVVRHAGARHVGIVLELRDGKMIGIVEDDGVGFDVEEARQRGRLGLAGMQERAEMIGGRMSIESAPGAGTTVFIEVPCDHEDPDR